MGSGPIAACRAPSGTEQVASGIEYREPYLRKKTKTSAQPLQNPKIGPNKPCLRHLVHILKVLFKEHWCCQLNTSGCRMWGYAFIILCCGEVISQPSSTTTGNNPSLTHPLSHSNCSIDCFSGGLNGPEQDRCGLWYQMEKLSVKGALELSCESFIASNISCCDLKAWHRVSTVCDEEGKVVSVNLWPQFEDDQGAVVEPYSHEGPLVPCTARHEGVLAPQLAALAGLRNIHMSTPHRGIYLSGTSQINHTTIRCTSIRWQGVNLTGSVPPEWGRLRVSSVSFGGNSGLFGPLPSKWALTANRVEVSRTQLVQRIHCTIDCIAFPLNGPQRDKCGLWYQMRRLGTRGQWLPPCEVFILGNQGVGRLTYGYGIEVASDRSGRMVKLVIWPQFKTPVGHEVLPFTGGTGGGPCIARFEGTLAPELSVVDQLQGINLRSAPPAIFLRGTAVINQSVVKCSSVLWSGDNLTGT